MDINTKDKSDKFILQFSEIGIEDVPFVGGKNAALGEMYQNLTSRGINIPNGFAITAHAYRYFLEKSGLDEKIKSILTGLDTYNILDLQKRGMEVRNAILSSKLPEELEEVISETSQQLSKVKLINNEKRKEVLLGLVMNKVRMNVDGTTVAKKLK